MATARTASGLLQNGQLEKAIESYQEALLISPDYPTLHNNIGNAFKELGEIERAVKCFKKAIEINPDFPDSHNNLGDALRELNQFDDVFDPFFDQCLMLQD